MSFFGKLFHGNRAEEAVEEREEGVSAAIKDILSKVAKQEIRLNYTKSESPLPVRSSKIGGMPDLPADFVWPEYAGIDYRDDTVKSRPLSFLAQINLKDVAAYDSEGLLPKTGLLSFFYEVISMTWGFKPGDQGSAKVCYFPEGTELVSTHLPEALEEDGILPECTLAFEAHISLPSYESFAELDITKKLDDDTWDEWEVYDACCEELGYEPDDTGDCTKLLGYPDVIQNPMEYECETVTRGYSTGSPEDSKKITKDEKEDIREKAKEWMLLFQMGTVSTEGYELMFGDCGYIYFWIRKEDLLARRFDRIWLILQCS